MTNIYFCKRHEESWSGGLIILAENKAKAKRLFTQKEGHPPISVKKLDATKSGVIYDDSER